MEDMMMEEDIMGDSVDNVELAEEEEARVYKGYNGGK